MKIMILMPLAEQRGGGELMLLHLMHQGRNQGIEWAVVFLQAGPMVEQVRAYGVPAFVVDGGRLRDVGLFWRSIGQIAALAKRENVHVIFSWMAIAHLRGSLIAARIGVPALWYQLGLPPDDSGIDRLATLLPTKGIFTCSQYTAAAQSRLRPRRRTCVVYPGAELERFASASLPTPSEARAHLGLPSVGPLIGMVGRLQHWKGMHTLLDALPALLQRHPNAHCVIVGGRHTLEPDYETFLQEKIATLHLHEHVTMTGQQRNVPEWMQAMDIIVHASDREPFGIVIVEAMALKKAVIAGDDGGPPEIITSGKEGLLTPFNDVLALQNAIEKYLSQPDFAQQAAASAFARSRTFSTQRYAERFIQATQEILG